MTVNANESWSVYLLQCSDGSFYTGVTTDLARRVRQHNGEIVGGANYTRGRRPVVLAWYEECENRSLAQQCEHSVRRLSRREKQRLTAKAAVGKDDAR